METFLIAAAKTTTAETTKLGWLLCICFSQFKFIGGGHGWYHDEDTDPGRGQSS